MNQKKMKSNDLSNNCTSAMRVFYYTRAMVDGRRPLAVWFGFVTVRQNCKKLDQAKIPKSFYDDD